MSDQSLSTTSDNLDSLDTPSDKHLDYKRDQIVKPSSDIASGKLQTDNSSIEGSNLSLQLKQDTSEATFNSDNYSSREKVRISLDVSLELYQTIKQLAEQAGTTKSNVLRKAIALLDIASKVKERGGQLVIQEPISNHQSQDAKTEVKTTSIIGI